MGEFWDVAGTYGSALLAVMGIIVTAAPREITSGGRKWLWIVAFAIVAFMTAYGTYISQNELKDEITGGDSWGEAEIIIYYNDPHARGINVSNQGTRYPLRNVRVWIYNPKEGFARPQLNVGDIPPNTSVIAPPNVNIIPDITVENHYIISIVANNGTTNEDLYMKVSKTADGKMAWNQHAEIYKMTRDGKKHILREIPWSTY